MQHAKKLRELLKVKKPLILPGAFNPLVGLAAKKAGFQALYFSGGAFSASMGEPDIGLVTLTELANQVRTIVIKTDLPLLVDADTGFGEATNVYRTVQMLEESGVAGIHIEDQRLPKRCGHLEGKELISTEAMCEKIKAARAARKNKDFFLMARCDAYAIEGLDGLIRRSKAYLKAGSDGLFPEGLKDLEEFKTFANAFPKIPLLANMTEFGKTCFISSSQFGEIGYKFVIFPVTLLRLAMKAVAKGLSVLKTEGTQKNLIEEMQTRKELYELLKYDDYVQLDRRIAYHEKRNKHS